MSDPNQPAEPLPVVPESSVPEDSPRWRIPHNLVVEDAVHLATAEIRKVLSDVKGEAASVLAHVRELATKNPTLHSEVLTLIGDFKEQAVAFTNTAFATLEQRLTDHASTVEQIIGTALEAVHAKVDQILTAQQATPAPTPAPTPEPAPAPMPAPTPEPAPAPTSQATTEAPLSPELVALEAENLELKEFPTLAEFVAEGFYADTYEYQKAQWQKKRDQAAATQAPANSEENAPSDPATGASSGSA